MGDSLMQTVKCTKCGQEKEAYLDNPYAGSKLGELIVNNVCKDCWRDWERMELMVINEYKLSPMFKEHRDIIIKEMKKYLNIPQ